MRYFLTLPFAVLALAATPAMAQDTAAQPDPATTQAPPVDPATPEPTNPTVGPTAPKPPSEIPPGPTPAEQVQNAPDTAVPATPVTPNAALTTEQKTAYAAWPAETKAYFDGLTPGRQQLFLRLADADKAKVAALPAAQQEAVWTSLEKQNAEQRVGQPMAN